MIVTLHTDRFELRQAAQHSPPFQHSVSRGPLILVQRFLVGVLDLFAIFKGRPGNIPSARRQRVTSNKPVHSMSKFYKLSEPAGSD